VSAPRGVKLRASISPSLTAIEGTDIMWEWIAMAIGTAFLGLYFYALRIGRGESLGPRDPEETGVPPPGE
jgi:hypothetical protein